MLSAILRALSACCFRVGLCPPKKSILPGSRNFRLTSAVGGFICPAGRAIALLRASVLSTFHLREWPAGGRSFCLVAQRLALCFWGLEKTGLTNRLAACPIRDAETRRAPGGQLVGVACSVTWNFVQLWKVLRPGRPLSTLHHLH